MLPTNTHILFPEFEYHAPTTVYEATELLAEFGDEARILAGGTDLLVQLKMERRQPAHVISLRRIPALHAISQNGDLLIGAATSIRRIYQSPHSNTILCLREACNLFSTVQIMYMATLGGNLCNASPAADSAPCLLVHDASVTVKSKTSERVVPLTDFFLAPGKSVMRADELLTYIHIPTPASNTGSAFLKISRVAADISQVCAAVKVVREGNTVRDARIALGSVAPTPFRAAQAKAALVGETFTPELAEYVGHVAAQEIKPISDVRASREYRQNVAAVIVRDALVAAWERSK